MKQTVPSQKSVRIRTLCESAVFLALAVILSYIKIWQLPFDGSITLLSMLPICLVAIRHGTAWGGGTAFCYAWFQILQGGVFSFGLTPEMLIASLLLDYLLAFTVLGLAGVFRKHGTVGKVCGVAMVCILRFAVHFLSGILLWANYAEFVAFGVEWVNHPILYSICYNGIYMLPETILTTAAAILLFRLPQTKRLLEQ